MARSWDFLGKLKENGKRVITDIKSTIETTSEKNPEVEVSELNGTVTLDIKIPEPGLTESESVGRVYKVEDETRGEIFNDYINNTATGKNSHVTGENNESAYLNQAVFGRYNKNESDNVIEVGWGTEGDRRNIATLDKEGKATFEVLTVKNDISFNNNKSLQQALNDKVSIDNIDTYLQRAEALIFGSANNYIITVTDIETVICSIDFVTKEEATPIFMMTIPVTMNYDGNVTFTYYLNDKILPNDTVTHYCNRGENIVTLINLLTVDENFNGTLKVKMKTSFFSSDSRAQEAEIKTIQRRMNGDSGITPIDTTVPTATIRAYGIKSALYVQGIGLSDAWNARLTFADTFPTIAIRKLDKIIFVPIIDKLEEIIGEKGAELFIFANEKYWNCDLNHWTSNKEFFEINGTTVVSARDNSIQDAIKINSSSISLDRWISQDIPSNNNGIMECLPLGRFGKSLTSLIIHKSLSKWEETINDVVYKTVFSMDDVSLYDFDRKYFTLDRTPYRFPLRKQFRLKGAREYENGPEPENCDGRITAANYEKDFSIRKATDESIKINYDFGIKSEDWNSKNVLISGFTNPINKTFQAMMIPIDNNGIGYSGDYPYNSMIHNRANEISISMKQIFSRYYCYHNFGTIITPRKMNYTDFYVYRNKYDEIVLNSNMVFSGKIWDKKDIKKEVRDTARDKKVIGESVTYVDIPINNIKNINDIKIQTVSSKIPPLKKNEIEIDSKNTKNYIRDIVFTGQVYDKFEEKTLTINWSIVRTVTKGEITMYCDIPMDDIAVIDKIKYKVVRV